MSLQLSPERIFTLSAFEGLRVIRQYQTQQPELHLDDLIELIQKVDPDGASLDLEASRDLDQIVPKDCPSETLLFYQLCIKCVLIECYPIWAKAMRAGRRRFVKTLGKNDRDLFAAAGLMTDPPMMGVVSWWDDVVGHSRLKIDHKKMEQARQAELLTIEHETDKLAKLGIEEAPRWIGLDDNYAGYDVLSYEFKEGEVVNLMIEVKSTTASPLRFFVTRNEWEQAEKAKSAYMFHVWDMNVDPPILHKRTYDQVMPHIPSDNESGKWSNATIPINV